MNTFFRKLELNRVLLTKTLILGYSIFFLYSFLTIYVLANTNYFLAIYIKKALEYLPLSILVVTLGVNFFLFLAFVRSIKKLLFTLLSFGSSIILAFLILFELFCLSNETLLSTAFFSLPSPDGKSKLSLYTYEDGVGMTFLQFRYNMLVLERPWQLPKTLAVGGFSDTPRLKWLDNKTIFFNYETLSVESPQKWYK